MSDAPAARMMAKVANRLDIASSGRKEGVPLLGHLVFVATSAAVPEKSAFLILKTFLGAFSKKRSDSET